MRTTPTRKGHLTPGQPVALSRIPAPDDLAHLVRQFRVPRWDLADGKSIEQLVLGYPASNVVVEAEGVGLYGPTTRASVKVLQGSGWAVGALLRPAGVLLFTGEPASLVNGHEQLYQWELHALVSQAMSAGQQQRAVELLGGFIRVRAGKIPAATMRQGLAANQMVDVLDEESDIESAVCLAARLNLSLRTVERLAARYVGMSPVLLLRRRRLQDAAERIRAHPDIDLPDLALELGFADQSHLTREFRTVLGFTPRQYPGGSA